WSADNHDVFHGVSFVVRSLILPFLHLVAQDESTTSRKGRIKDLTPSIIMSELHAPLVDHRPPSAHPACRGSQRARPAHAGRRLRHRHGPEEVEGLLGL